MRSERVVTKRVVLSLLGGLFAVLVVVTLTGALNGRVQGEHPFARQALERGRWFSLSGVVVERLRAGPYTYLRVRTPARDAWVVTLGATPDARSSVRVTVMGRAVAFRSARLRRTFDELLFAIVRPSPSLASRTP